ncbi:hypothetical protein LWF01_04650 [Saxibacter everestensis]|uniref:Secreted protein n=1 Tax=Saxibacter everestensis TaxID=2909229 RepID=A0ABY8QVV3_9MICO|nr:hypothetical protein LWF01_04650 [Brevibacteriaceae bacterium ZFBP1038]
MSVIVIGLIVCVAIAAIIVLLVALPGLRAEGRLPDNESDAFRLPSSWTGSDDDREGISLFDDVDEYQAEVPDTAQESEGAQGSVAVLEAEEQPLEAPMLQNLRHAVPPVWTVRPRTRHWEVPESGTGMKTGLRLLFGKGADRQ